MSSEYINIPNSGNFTWQPAVPTAADLPVNGNQIGDARITLDTNDAYTWNGTEWVLISSGGGGGGGGEVNIHDSLGNNIINGQQTMANSLPVVIASNQSPLVVNSNNGQSQTLLLDNQSSTTTYVGKAPTGSLTSAAVWLIFQMVTDPTTGNLTLLYANGSTAYNSIWNNRYSLTYS